MTDFEIPAAMVEAGAAQLAREWTADLNGVSPTDSWQSPPVPSSMEENWRERYRAAARRLLAAALSVCVVREQTGHDRECSVRRHSWQCPDATLRRLVITTPAEQVDTEGAPK